MIQFRVGPKKVENILVFTSPGCRELTVTLRIPLAASLHNKYNLNTRVGGNYVADVFTTSRTFLAFLASYLQCMHDRLTCDLTRT